MARRTDMPLQRLVMSKDSLTQPKIVLQAVLTAYVLNIYEAPVCSIWKYTKWYKFYFRQEICVEFLKAMH